MSVEIKQITEPLILGEGPHWDDRTQVLFFIDIHGKTIHKYDPATGRHTRTSVDGRPGFIVPVEGHSDRFLVGLESEFVVLQWDGEDGSDAKIIQRLGGEGWRAAGDRINDGKADPRGRVFAGSTGKELTGPLKGFEKEKAGLYRVDEREVTQVDHKIGLGNGLAWDEAAKAMYYIDTLERKIRRYDYDVETGEISNMSYIYEHLESGTWLDGCTIDTDGNLWVAAMLGGYLAQISPSGEMLRRVPMPVRLVSSCTFGGPNLDVLFVTSAHHRVTPEQRQPQDGCTFMVTGLGVRGHKNRNFKLVLKSRV